MSMRRPLGTGPSHPSREDDSGAAAGARRLPADCQDVDGERHDLLPDAGVSMTWPRRSLGNGAAGSA